MRRLNNINRAVTALSSMNACAAEATRAMLRFNEIARTCIFDSAVDDLRRYMRHKLREVRREASMRMPSPRRFNGRLRPVDRTRDKARVKA